MSCYRRGSYQNNTLLFLSHVFCCHILGSFNKYSLPDTRIPLYKVRILCYYNIYTVANCTTIVAQQSNSRADGVHGSL
jgi:hypothetical protein